MPTVTEPHAPRPSSPPVSIVPSILAADFAALRDEIAAVAAAEWLHIDVMDGRFVPNISVGPPVVEAVRRVTRQRLDVHLMIVEPERYIDAFAAAGADLITVHAEACVHLHRTLQQIHKHGLLAGVALNPATPPSALEWVVDDIDLVLVMTVNPGFGGQKFLPTMLRKVAAVRAMLSARPEVIIEVDGGVDSATAPALAQAGARALVAGTAVFQAPSPQQALMDLTKIAQQAVAG